MKTKRKILGLLALVAFASACEKKPEINMDPPSNPLMGYKWENVWPRVIDGENTTYTTTLYFETDSTGKYMTKFVAPGDGNSRVEDFVYAFEGDSGTMKLPYDGGRAITYDETSHELYWWRWRTYDGKRDSAMVFTRYNL